MKEFKVKVLVTIKPAVLNPEEKPVAKRLVDLGFASVSRIQMGKYMIITLKAESEDEARGLATEMCKKLLANQVTETFEIDWVQEAKS